MNLFFHFINLVLNIYPQALFPFCQMTMQFMKFLLLVILFITPILQILLVNCYYHLFMLLILPFIYYFMLD